MMRLLTLAAVVLAAAAACNGTTPFDYCAALSACCPSISATEVHDECTAAVDKNDNKGCMNGLRSLQSTGLCLGDGGAGGGDASHLTPSCQQLSACCSSLPGDQQVACFGALAGNDPAMCQAALDSYVQAGSCTAP
jgi:hypothetical protein